MVLETRVPLTAVTWSPAMLSNHAVLVQHPKGMSLQYLRRAYPAQRRQRPGAEPRDLGQEGALGGDVGQDAVGGST